MLNISLDALLSYRLLFHRSVHEVLLIFWSLYKKEALELVHRGCSEERLLDSAVSLREDVEYRGVVCITSTHPLNCNPVMAGNLAHGHVKGYRFGKPMQLEPAVVYHLFGHEVLVGLCVQQYLNQVILPGLRFLHPHPTSVVIPRVISPGLPRLLSLTVGNISCVRKIP